jgi:hypothetical protein
VIAITRKIFHTETMTVNANVDWMPPTVLHELGDPSRVWRTLQTGAPNGPMLFVTSVDILTMTRGFADALRDTTILCGQVFIPSLPEVRGRTVGFLGGADYPDLLLYCQIATLCPLIRYVGTSDRFLRAIGAPLAPQIVPADSDELAAVRLAVDRGNLRSVIGEGVTETIEKTESFVAHPLPWCVREGRVKEYVAAIVQSLA